MKVLITTGVYQIGGPATYTRLLQDNLPKHDIGVDFLTFDQVRHLPKIVRHLFFLFKILAKHKDFDVIFAQDPVSVGLPSLLAVKLLRKKLVIRFVGDYAWEQGRQRFGVMDSLDDFQHKRYGWRVELFRSIEIFVLNQADRIITPSIYFGAVAKNLVKNPEKVQPIYNGIDTSSPLVDRETARQRVHLDNDLLILFSAGRLVNWKGYDALFKVLVDLIKENKKYRLFIAGDGPDEERLKKISHDLGLDNYVIFLGRLKREELMVYLQAADIFVLNTGFESFSFQVVEAMYYGVPVITTNLCNLPEIITDKENGLLVEYNNVEQIKESVHRLLSDDNFRLSIVAQAKNRAAYFAIDKTAASVISLLKNL